MSGYPDFNHWLQGQLTAHGFPCGVIDGRIGPVTLAALRAFEAANGLPVNGTADGDVIKALRAPAAIATPNEMAAIPDRDVEEEHPAEPAVTVANIWPRQRDVSAYYDKVGTDQTSVPIPFDMYLAWDKATRIRKITLHRKVADSAGRVFEKIAGLYSAPERAHLGLDLFGGSLNVRKMRGGSSWSMHSWGVAIDFDPIRNQLKWGAPKARLSQPDAVPFWQAWEAEGWLSLGRARDFDWMHVQAARL